MYRLNRNILHKKTTLMQRPINNNMVNARRFYSSEGGSQGGKGLTWVALFALAAGGYMLWNRKESRKFYIHRGMMQT
jgi:hypothetical protein